MKAILVISLLTLSIIAKAQLREGTYFTDSVTHIDLENGYNETLIERSEYGFDNDTLYNNGYAIYLLKSIEKDQYEITPLIDPDDKGILKVTQNENHYILELSFNDETGILYLNYLNDQVRKVGKYPVGISEIE